MTTLDTVLGWIGAADPGEDTEVLLDLERRIGQRMPEETRSLIRSAPVLEHPDAEDHPEIEGLPFAEGLPDIDAFLVELRKGLLGRYLSTVHFIGAVPVGVQLQYGDFMYALARIEPWHGDLGGMLYYDEREVGTYGASIMGFLHRQVSSFREAVDGQLDGLDADERASFVPNLDYLRDCFVLEGCDPLAKTPEIADPAAGHEEAWDEAWRADMARMAKRWWIPDFLGSRLDAYDVTRLPRPADWEAEKANVGVRYADTMYWVLVHALLDNGPELEDALSRASSHPSTHVQALCAAAPALVGRHEAQREALYAVERKSTG